MRVDRECSYVQIAQCCVACCVVINVPCSIRTVAVPFVLCSLIVVQCTHVAYYIDHVALHSVCFILLTILSVNSICNVSSDDLNKCHVS